MANDVQNTTEQPALTTLVKGIVSDIGDLIKQEFKFAQAEIKKDLSKTGQASGLLGAGLGVSFFSLLFFCLMLVYLLHWATMPQPDRFAAEPGLPLWACFGIVGVGILTIGGILVFVGKKKFNSFNPLPDETVQNMKENVQWLTNPK